MVTHAPGSPILHFMPLADAGGQPIASVSALRWRVLDEAGAVVLDWANLALPGADPETGEAATGVTVTIPGLNTQLGAGVLRAARLVELEITAPSGVFTVQSDPLLIQATSILAVGLNSHCTYVQAVMIAPDYTEQALAGWVRTTSRLEREQALIEAWNALQTLPLRTDGTTRTKDWLRGLTPEEYLLNTTPAQRQALQRAQVLEASAVLEADPLLLARRNGMVSMTVGESSQYFGQGRALSQGTLSRTALELLRPWLDYSVRIGRVG